MPLKNGDYIVVTGTDHSSQTYMGDSYHIQHVEGNVAVARKIGSRMGRRYVGNATAPQTLIYNTIPYQIVSEEFIQARHGNDDMAEVAEPNLNKNAYANPLVDFTNPGVLYGQNASYRACPNEIKHVHDSPMNIKLVYPYHTEYRYGTAKKVNEVKLEAAPADRVDEQCGT